MICAFHKHAQDVIWSTQLEPQGLRAYFSRESERLNGRCQKITGLENIENLASCCYACVNCYTVMTACQADNGPRFVWGEFDLSGGLCLCNMHPRSVMILLSLSPRHVQVCLFWWNLSWRADIPKIRCLCTPPVMTVRPIRCNKQVLIGQKLSQLSRKFKTKMTRHLAKEEWTCNFFWAILSPRRISHV